MSTALLRATHEASYSERARTLRPPIRTQDGATPVPDAVRAPGG
ncbi:hypothetical protein [Streptomyces cellostaticus]|nr:hypothetical protein [Streptomyces cellostaticus]